jgi:hypothetical protein
MSVWMLPVIGGGCQLAGAGGQRAPLQATGCSATMVTAKDHKMLQV